MEATCNKSTGYRCSSKFAEINECALCPHSFRVDGKLFCRHKQCITVKILDRKEMKERRCQRCPGFAGMKGPKEDCWGYCKYEKCPYVRMVPSGMVRSHQCKQCLHFAGRKAGHSYCKKRFCDLVDEEYLKYEREREKQSECYKCPYANPAKPCVGFCLKKMLKGAEQ